MCTHTTAAIAAAMLSASAMAGSEGMQIVWSVNGGAPNVLNPPAVDNGDGTVQYGGTVMDPGSGLFLTYEMQADPLGMIDGDMSLSNDLKTDVNVNVKVTLPTGQVLAGGSKLKSIVTVALVTGPGGGEIGSQPPALWRMDVDDQPASFFATLFYHPFLMSNSGIGVSSTTQHFGIPTPINGPPVTDSIGFEVAFVLSEQDLGAVSTTMTVTGCPGDINGDGIVNTVDLSMLLEEWGPCPSGCDADLDADGATGVLDFLELLANWGSCD